MYDYRNRAIIDLPFRMEQHDATNGKSLNVGRGGSDLDADFGAAAAEPTKLSHQRGYNFDGGDHMVISHGSGFSYADAMSIMLMFILNSKAADAYIAEKRSGFDEGFEVYYRNATDNLYFLVDGGGTAASATSLTNPSIGKIYTLVGTYDGAAANIYINGAYENAANETGSIANSIDMYLGANDGNADYLTGSILHCALTDFVMTPLQVADYHIQMLKKINEM